MSGARCAFILTIHGFILIIYTLYAGILSPLSSLLSPLSNVFQPLLGPQLTFSVSRIRVRRVAFENLAVRLLLAYRAENTQRTDINELLYRHREAQNGTHKMLRTLGIGAEKVLAVQALRSSGSVHYIVEIMPAKLLRELFLASEVKFYEADAGVLQVLP